MRRISSQMVPLRSSLFHTAYPTFYTLQNIPEASLRAYASLLSSAQTITGTDRDERAPHGVDVSATSVGIIQPSSLIDYELVATAMGIKSRQDGGDGPLDVGAGFAELYVDSGDEAADETVHSALFLTCTLTKSIGAAFMENLEPITPSVPLVFLPEIEFESNLFDDRQDLLDLISQERRSGDIDFSTDSSKRSSRSSLVERTPLPMWHDLGTSSYPLAGFLLLSTFEQDPFHGSNPRSMWYPPLSPLQIFSLRIQFVRPFLGSSCAEHSR